MEAKIASSLGSSFSSGTQFRTNDSSLKTIGSTNTATEIANCMKTVIDTPSDFKSAVRVNINGQKFNVGDDLAGKQSTIALCNDTAEFEDAKTMRDKIYNHWLVEKKEKMKHRKIRETKNKIILKQEEQMKNEKSEEVKAAAIKKLEDWEATKDVVMAEKRRFQQEKLKEETITLKKAEERKQDIEQAIGTWKKVKEDKIKLLHAKEKERSEEEEKKKIEEAEKRTISEKAFGKWLENKKQMCETPKKEKKEDTKPTTKDLPEAFEVWKQKKDEQIKSQKFNVKTTEANKQPWRPARSIKYDYPQPPDSQLNGESKMLKSSSSISSVGSATNSIPTTPGTHGQTDTKKLKSVQVCCQTLEYWCTCNKK